MTSNYLSSTQLSRIMALKEKRKKLKSHIHDLKNKAESGFYLVQLKKQNLLLKDEINTIERIAANT